MPHDYPRNVRVGELLHRELASLVREKIKAPGGGMITIREVTVSRDLRHAKVYYSILGNEVQKAAGRSEIEKQAPMLRRELAHRVVLRRIPALQFLVDETEEKAIHLDHLIEEAVRRDEEKHQQDPD